MIFLYAGTWLISCLSHTDVRAFRENHDHIHALTEKENTFVNPQCVN